MFLTSKLCLAKKSEPYQCFNFGFETGTMFAYVSLSGFALCKG